MDEFTVDPVRIPHAEQVELSYNKRESVTRQSRRKLAQDIHESIIYNWIPEGVKVVETLGEAVAAHIKEATGSRKRMTKQTIESSRRFSTSRTSRRRAAASCSTHGCTTSC